MKTVMKKMIFLGMTLFLLGAGTLGCKQRNEDEEIEQLVEKLGQAKTEREAEAIANKIAKLEERKQKKETKEINAEFGKAFTFWEFGGVVGMERETQFSLTFESISVHEKWPFPYLGHVSYMPAIPKGKKYVRVTAKVTNLGPREGAPTVSMELKVDKGHIYNCGAYGRLCAEPRYDPDPFLDLQKNASRLEPGQTAWKFFLSEIPQDTTPVELFGTLGGTELRVTSGKQTFRLTIARRSIAFGEDTSNKKQVDEQNGGSKDRRATSAPQTGAATTDDISRRRIAGRYVIEAVKNDGTLERPPGVTILQEDGTIKLESSGSQSLVPETKWEFRDGVVQFYRYGPDQAWEPLPDRGEVKGDTITFRVEEGEVRYIREGAKTVSSVKQISKGDLPPSLPYGQEKDFVQPCSDSGGYYGWLAGPNKDHLGHDYNASVGTKVKAISDGNVWDTYSNISGFGSEGKPGPAIWIKHRLANGKYFYALYGHIKPGSDILKGAKVKAGQIIGTVIEYRDKISKEDISHLHLGIWNSESDPPLLKMGYGPTRDFTDPIKFLQENKPYVKEEPQQTVDPGGKCRIAVIPKGTVHIFWKSIHAGAVKAEQELKDLGVEVIWKGPLKEDDRESQIRVMEGFITSGVSGIVLAPQDDEALRGSVEEAVGSGIPVVIIDSDLKSEKYVSFVATDNYIGGRKGGKRLAEILGGKGKVVMLRYQVGSASTTNREKGFMDVLKEEYPQIQVVSANQYGGATTESAYKASENVLAPLHKPDGGLTIDGIFCPNESTTFGMLRALQDSHLAGKVKYVGFDNSESLVQPLRNGHIHGLVLQDPINMGYLGVKTMFEHLQGKKVEKRIDTGSEVATPENMNDPRIRSLLAPDFRKVLTNSN